jgi:hypothetical protein
MTIQAALDGISRWFPSDGVEGYIKLALIVPPNGIGSGGAIPREEAMIALSTPFNGISFVFLAFRPLDFAYPLLASLQPSNAPKSNLGCLSISCQVIAYQLALFGLCPLKPLQRGFFITDSFCCRSSSWSLWCIPIQGLDRWH